MHTKAKLLSACITLLIASANALPTSREVNSKFIVSIAKENWKDQGVEIDISNDNNLILHECHFSKDRLKGNCDISGLPADETTLQRCNNLTINASHSDSVHVRVKSVHRFRDNKLLVHVIEEVRNQRDLKTLHIFDNCVPVNVVSFVDSKDGSVVDLRQVIIYEDGFDIIEPNSDDENTTLHYHSFDSDGKHIGNFTVLPEQLPRKFSEASILIFAKRHSRGFSFPSGYHFYPNGSIIRFADDRSTNESYSIQGTPEDEPFYTTCNVPIAQLFNDSAILEDIHCWQYDVDHARLFLKVQFTPPRASSFPTGLRNLSKGGFLMAMSGNSMATVYVFRPDRPTFIDNIDLGLNGEIAYVSNFDEITGELTVFRKTMKESCQLIRSSYFLQNYASA